MVTEGGRYPVSVVFVDQDGTPGTRHTSTPGVVGLIGMGGSELLSELLGRVTPAAKSDRSSQLRRGTDR